METQVMVSVIIPVYNAEKHLKQCLDSLLEQGVPEGFYEIICINDGSTDLSLSIINEYAQRRRNVIVVDKNNEGVSATRNKGLDMARGKYIWFVDADDWIAKNFLKNGFAPLVSQDCSQIPLILTKCIDVRDHEAEQYAQHQILEGEVGTEQVSPFMTTSRGHFFDRALIEKYQLRYDTNLAYGEDLMFMREFLDAVRFENEKCSCGYRMLQCNGKGSYLYRIHNDSAMGQLGCRVEKVADSILYRAHLSQERYRMPGKPAWYTANYQEYVHLHMKEYMLYYFPLLDQPMRVHLQELKQEGLYPAPPPKLGWTKPNGMIQKVQQIAFRYHRIYPLYYFLMRRKFKKAGTA